MSTGTGELVVNPKTLYVGNLDVSVSEDLLCTLFSQIGNVKGCKIIREIASTLLCVLLIGQGAFAVINKSSAQSTVDKDTSETKDVIAAEDRIISEVYGAPPPLSNDYGPPAVGGGFNGPAPVYGPPELTGHHGPVQVHPPPPPELPPPPPPHTYGPPRKPKPHYGPPKTPFGPPPLPFGPKPIYGPPKLHFGLPTASFGSPKPQYGPPLKVSGSSNHQFGPLPHFGGHKNNGHGPSIPISLEHYGPPNREPLLHFGAAPQKDFALPSPTPPQNHHGLQSAGDLYGPPPPPPPPGVPAPPTPPDIKYDGWQPIAGLVGAPHNLEQLDDTYGPPESGNGNIISHNSASESSISHSSGSHSSTLLIENSKQNVPSNSYGEPIHNPEAQHLQTSVYESTNSHGLPPPPLPQSEPLHNNQGPAPSIPGHQGHQQHFESNHQSNHFGGSDLSGIQFDHSISTDLKAPTLEILSEASALTGDSHGLAHSEGSSAFGGSSSTSFASSAAHSFHNDVGSALSLPSLSLGTSGIFSSSNSHQHLTDAHHAGGQDLTLQQLPFHGPSLSFSGSLSGGRGHGHGNPSHPHVSDSYSVPPASSYSPNGRYPGSQGSRGGYWHSSFNTFGSSNFNKHHGNGNHHYHHHRNHGPPRFGPPPAVNGFLIPPRNRAPIKFREQIPAGLLANINRYLPPITKPPINYGAPIEQQLPSFNGPHSFKSSSSNSFGNSIGSSNSFAKNNVLSANTPIAAPHAQYGTPLSFSDFNTPAPTLTYGAPNFGPTNSFISTSFGGFGAAGNLYKNIASNAITATYGTPIHSGDFGGHDCNFQKSGSQLFDQHNSIAQNAGHFSNLLQSTEITGAINSEHGAVNQQLTSFPAASIHELDLESHERQQGELKDSYGNPIALSVENFDQAGAALTTNDIRSESVSSSNGYSSSEAAGQLSHGQHQNSYAPGATFSNGDDISAEALTAALTAQGYGQSKNYVSNEVVQSASNHHGNVHAGDDEALALALQAEGANDFQIQGSKGTYTLQIQSADGSLGTENSDGTIRHEQVLSNGLLQDILAAIEQPVDGPVQIQGAPQPQQLQEVYGDAIANAAHQQQVSVHHQQAQDIIGSHNELVQQVLTIQGEKTNSNNIQKSLNGEEQVALFYDNTGGYENSRKDIRSTSKSEAQAALTSNKNSDDNRTSNSNSRAETTKKSS